MRKPMPDRTMEEVLAAIKKIEEDPRSLNIPGRLEKFHPRARAKLDELRWEVTRLLRQKRLAAGLPINDEGYSGRKSHRR